MKILDDITHNRLCDKFDELSSQYDPFLSETNRQAFRAAWEAYLVCQGVTEEEFDNSLSERLKKHL